MSEVKSINQIQREQFNQLIRRRHTWIWIGILGLIGAVTGFFVSPGGPIPGLFLLFTLAGVGIAYAIAGSRAKAAFYDAYAQARGLVRTDGEPVDGLTPLLRKNARQRSELNRTFTGPLADGFEGTLALYNHVDVSKDLDDEEVEKDYQFTLVLVDLPDTGTWIPWLAVLCRRRSRFFAPSRAETVTLESLAILDRYRIHTKGEQDQVSVRELFSPSFIVWLTEAPRDLAFELDEGKLCAFFPGHRRDAAGLDEVVAAACHVAGRLRDEAGESAAIA
jgi:hypothetical protein